MKFISTRFSAPELSFEETIMQGLASDGGLYVPKFLPKFDEKEIKNMRKMAYSELFFEVTKHFVEGEIEEKIYKKIIAYSYKKFEHKAIAPFKQLDSNHFLLELFHGPTLAFKDFALQFLGNLLDYFLEKRGEKIAIIGATSGDTGSAAIHGCMNCKNAQIFILHPFKKVSNVQRMQMTSVLQKNVTNIAVKGNFDDCQAMVKKMFKEENDGRKFLKNRRMVAVNSINFARIMAQIVYYFYVAVRLGCSDKNPISFSVPTGNFGDIYGGFLAKNMGLNINKLVVATNSNDILTRFFKDNDYSRSNLVETISPSMNIQVSSNFERMIFSFYKKHGLDQKMAATMESFEELGYLKVDDEILRDIRSDFDAYCVDDKATKEVIKRIYDQTQEILDPHSAIGVKAAKDFMKSDGYKGELVVSLATAHPAKFPESLQELDLPKVNLPAFLDDLLNREEKYEILENDFDVVKNFIAGRV